MSQLVAQAPRTDSPGSCPGCATHCERAAQPLREGGCGATRTLRSRRAARPHTVGHLTAALTLTTQAERKAATLCAAPRLRQLARRIRALGQGSSAVAESLLLGSPPWSKRPPHHGQSARLGSAPARLLRLLSARLAALGGSALPERGPATGRPATALGAQASCLQRRRFQCV